MHISNCSGKVLVICAVTISLTSAFARTPANNEKILHAFRGSDGAGPGGALIADGSGNLYGPAENGGEGGCALGCGVVFEIDAHHKETTLYKFQGGNDGAYPGAGLVLDGAGNLYGTTTEGGGTGCGAGCGTVFKLAPDGTESIFYSFQGGSDGWVPMGQLAMDENGNLYGATADGGNYNGSTCDVDGCGTVFELQPGGTKMTLHAFQSGSDGDFPLGGVIMDANGNLYGTTFAGGSAACNGDGCGSVFEIPFNGAEAVIYAFQGSNDGAAPFAGVTLDGAGNLYGTTAVGGECGIQYYQNNCGTVYKITPGGNEAVLYDFQGGNDGLSPQSGLTIDSTGNLYGTTNLGGGKCRRMVNGCGTLFELTPTAKETVLLAFGKKGIGANPTDAPLVGKHGALLGTATGGGRFKDGVVFELKTKQ